ncbi:unnamed protein product [Paramecium primaurelia]|uniref:Uncharacterized protein n=1 Tax=Paramecium primaurelia TaxID=5886 RepID=A0A8S1M9A9_PARPR|nr:unnamed protein product [Paramecium primaurelia]
MLLFEIISHTNYQDYQKNIHLIKLIKLLMIIILQVQDLIQKQKHWELIFGDVKIAKVLLNIVIDLYNLQFSSSDELAIPNQFKFIGIESGIKVDFLNFGFKIKSITQLILLNGQSKIMLILFY